MYLQQNRARILKRTQNQQLFKDVLRRTIFKKLNVLEGFLGNNHYLMSKSKKRNTLDKKKLLRETVYLTTAPRLDGDVKDFKINPIKKKKQK